MLRWGRTALSLVLLGLAACEHQTAAAIGITGLPLTVLRDDRAADNRMAVVSADVLYCYPPTGDLIVIPAGYITDFASVPGAADRIVNQYGDNMEAAVVHDWLYAVGEPGKKDYADQLFRYAMREQGVRRFERNAGFVGVWLGGARAYGDPQEWQTRFYDLETGRVTSPPFVKPASAVVAVLEDCRVMNSRSEVRRLTELYGSHTWRRVEGR